MEGFGFFGGGFLFFVFVFWADLVCVPISSVRSGWNRTANFFVSVHHFLFLLLRDFDFVLFSAQLFFDRSQNMFICLIFAVRLFKGQYVCKE